jgi:hypothetical protein
LRPVAMAELLHDDLPFSEKFSADIWSVDSVPLLGDLIDSAQMDGHVHIERQFDSDAETQSALVSISDHRVDKKKKFTKHFLVAGNDRKPLTWLNRTTLDFPRITARLPSPC